MREPGFYRHYKGGYYELVGFAVVEATRECVAVYRPCYENALLAQYDAQWFTRPVSEFFGYTEDGTIRFIRVHEEDVTASRPGERTA
jgi:hypothetical protein